LSLFPQCGLEHANRRDTTEILNRHVLSAPFSRDKRRIDCLVGELERAVMVAERKLRTAIDECLQASRLAQLGDATDMDFVTV
jgi:C4-dicarboxylate-specific signal transduction histidine kinase